MHGQSFVTAAAKAVEAWIFPDVGSVAAFATETEIVDRPSRRRIDANQFMLRPVKAPHSGVGLDPHNEVLGLPEYRISRGLKLELVSPVHAKVSDRAVRHPGLNVCEDDGEKVRELAG